MSWREGLTGSWLGGIIRGVVKITLATAIAAILGNINMDLSSVTIGGVTVNLQVIWDVTRIFAPILLIFSGLRDMGVRL